MSCPRLDQWARRKLAGCGLRRDLKTAQSMTAELAAFKRYDYKLSRIFPNGPANQKEAN